MDIQEQQQMSLMEITRILTRIEQKMDRILSEPSCKTPEEWKAEKIRRPPFPKAIEEELTEKIRSALVDPIPY